MQGSKVIWHALCLGETTPSESRKEHTKKLLISENNYCINIHYKIILLYVATDEPKAPGPVEIEQLVYGKVIITWGPSPDHKRDDRLHYMVEEHNSNTRNWRTIADRLLCTTYTTSIQPGQEYHFRVYAKNDMGLSSPSDSPTWGVNSNKGG